MIEKRIRAVGEPTGIFGLRNKPVCKVRCQGCGEYIHSDQTTNVEYVKTKRGTELFFHTGCADKIWDSRIV